MLEVMVSRIGPEVGISVEKMLSEIEVSETGTM